MAQINPLFCDSSHVTDYCNTASCAGQLESHPKQPDKNIVGNVVHMLHAKYPFRAVTDSQDVCATSSHGMNGVNDRLCCNLSFCSE